MLTAGKTCLLLGVILSLLIAVAGLIDNLFLTLGLAVAGLLAAWLVAARVNAPLRELYECLYKMNTDHRAYLLDAVQHWKTLGPLGQQAGDALIFNMQRREYYRSAIMAVGTPFLICNKEGRITHASQALLDLLKKTAKDIIGRSVSQAFYNKEGNSITEQALQSGQPINADRDLTLWNGQVLSCYFSTNCFRGIKGDLLGAVSCIIDLAELRKEQQRLEETQTELHNLGGDINELAQRVASASEELSASSDEQARGAQQQKQQADAVSTSMTPLRPGAFLGGFAHCALLQPAHCTGAPAAGFHGITTACAYCFSVALVKCVTLALVKKPSKPS